MRTSLASQVVQSSDESLLSLVRVYRDRSESSVNDNNVSTIVEKTAVMLQNQWPRRKFHQPPLDEEDDLDYYRDLIVHHDESYPNYSLACSYILIQQKSNGHHEVLGHGRLTEVYESGGGNAAAITYIVIDEQYRGEGYGTTLLRLLEREAISKERLNCQYHFIYLWCTLETAKFYKRIGYVTSKSRVSLHRPCLKILSAASVQTLEDVLSRHCSAINKHNDTKKKIETVTLLQSFDNQKNKNASCDPKEDDVWLRKRLVDHVESIHVTKKDRIDQIEKFTTSHFPSTSSAMTASWFYRWNSLVPWQPQIGPSCGLTSIRMIKDFYCCSSSKEATRSLLAYAQRRGYTKDGEIFHVEHLREMLEACINIGTGTFEVRSRETSSLTMEEIDSNLKMGGLWILPYDNNPFTKLPFKAEGRRAHWGILVAILYRRTETSTQTNLTTTTPLLISLDEKVASARSHDFISSDCYWCVQHSLLSDWAIAPMKEYIESNAQLTFFDDSRFSIASKSGIDLQNKIIQIAPLTG